MNKFIELCKKHNIKCGFIHNLEDYIITDFYESVRLGYTYILLTPYGDAFIIKK